jgi:hypothetical protein
LKELEQLWLADKLERTLNDEKYAKEALELCYKNYKE